MNGIRVRVGTTAALVLTLILGMLTTIGMVEAAVGDLLANVTIPASAGCVVSNPDTSTTVYGNVLAVVPGGKLGFPSTPSLLVTSCVKQVPVGENDTTTASVIFFLDPSTNPATLVGTVNAGTTAWDGLVFRADTADLLGCQTAFEGPVGLSVIHFSPYDTVAAPGNVSFLTTAPATATCDGVAWDSKDKSIYQTSSSGNSTSPPILKFAVGGAANATSIPSGCGTFDVSGIGIAGVSLFVGCSSSSRLDGGPAGVPSIRQLDKANGNLVRTIANASLPALAAGVPDDPTTFGVLFKDALWSKETISSSPGNALLAFEIPGGTLGQSAGPPLAFPAACDQTTGATPDTDGDGLLDCWEDGHNWADGLPGISLDGIYSPGRAITNRAVLLCVDQNGNGVFDAGECATPTKKDIFVEIDYMQFHNPNATAMTNVITAFANAPVANPDGTTGIRLHLQVDEQLAHVNAIALPPCTALPNPGDANFDTIKAASFGTVAERGSAAKLNAKRNAYRYLVIAHNQTGTTSSGCAEIGGNDFIMTLGSFTGATVKNHTGGVGTTDQQGGTLMHELGHTLGLRHGGDDNINCKPNYPSVMSYSRQFSSPLNPRPLDYSRVELPMLDETALNETAGVGPFIGSIIYGPPVSIPLQGTKPVVLSLTTANAPVNWNGGTVGVVASDVNNTGVAGCPASPGEQLFGFNDWPNLQFNFRASMDFSDGAHSSIDGTKAGDAGNSTNALPGSLEITPEEAVAMAYDTDLDGVSDILDNCPFTPNGPLKGLDNQLDSDGDGIGDACQVGISILRPSIPSTSQGVVQIAIFSTAVRDATMIDPTTVAITGQSVTGPGFWSLPVKNAQCSKRDANGDKRIDLVCQFKVDARLLPIGTSLVTLDAFTFGGEAVRGTDTLDVRDVGNGN